MDCRTMSRHRVPFSKTMSNVYALAKSISLLWSPWTFFVGWWNRRVIFVDHVDGSASKGCLRTRWRVCTPAHRTSPPPICFLTSGSWNSIIIRIIFHTKTSLIESNIVSTKIMDRLAHCKNTTYISHLLDEHFLDDIFAFFITLTGFVTLDVSPANQCLAAFTRNVTHTMEPSHQHSIFWFSNVHVYALIKKIGTSYRSERYEHTEIRNRLFKKKKRKDILQSRDLPWWPWKLFEMISSWLVRWVRHWPQV